MDDTLDLLDYEEEEIEKLLQPDELKVATEVVKDVNGSNSHTSIHPIEFYFSPGGNMKCPVEECNQSKFASKGKFQRHWEEKHVKTNIKYFCSVSKCSAVCRRRYDMKTHMRKVHHMSDNKLVEDAVVKCKKCVEENKGFVDPGFWIYKGKTLFPKTDKVSSTSTASTVSTAVTAATISSVTATTMSASVTTSTTSTTSDPPITTTTAMDDDEPEFTVKIPKNFPTKISVDDYKTRPTVIRNLDTSFGYNSKPRQETGTQTTSSDYKPIVLPPIPTEKEELEQYIKWLCLSMDEIGRTREIAKERLNELRRDGSKLDQERKLRRNLEVENRRLQREIAEMKWRSTVFDPLHEQ